jgi:hypothetical protein
MLPSPAACSSAYVTCLHRLHCHLHPLAYDQPGYDGHVSKDIKSQNRTWICTGYPSYFSEWLGRGSPDIFMPYPPYPQTLIMLAATSFTLTYHAALTTAVTGPLTIFMLTTTPHHHIPYKCPNIIPTKSYPFYPSPFQMIS